jgi:diguanylate cyclase (GGDEF)-like protein
MSITMSTVAEIDAILESCQSARHSGDHQSGATFAESALKAAAGLGDHQRKARALAMLALHRLRLDELQASITAGERAIDLLPASAESIRSDVHSTVGIAYLNAGLIQQAIHHATAALTNARKSGVVRTEIQALSRVGLTYEAAGEPTKAEAAAREALALARIHGDIESMFMSLHNLSATLSAIAKRSVSHDARTRTLLEESADHQREASEFARQSGNAHRLLTSTAALGDLLVHLGHRNEALALLEDALTWPAIHDLPRTRLLIEISLANADRDVDVDQAIAAFAHLVERPELQANPTLSIKVHGWLHELYKSTGHFQLALDHFEKYVELKLTEVEQTAGLQSRILVNRLDVEQARHDVDVANTRAAEFQHMADHDPLTGLHNRRVLNDSVPKAIVAAHRSVRPLSFAILDIDHFKSVNDTHGHGIGDRVIATVAEIITNHGKTARVIARIGGEEFLLVIDADLEKAFECADNIRLHIAAYDWSSIADNLAVTVSVGMAQLTAHEETRQILSRADDALFSAKRQGRNRVCNHDQVCSEPANHV